MKSSMTKATHGGMIIIHAKIPRPTGVIRAGMWQLKDNYKHMKKKLLLLGLLALHYSCNEKENTEKQVTMVETAPVSKQTIVLSDQYPAATVALQEVELRADVSGYITNILFRDGQQVKKGQLLYEIDKSRYQANLDQSQSRLRIAASNLERAERDLDRYQKLKEGNAIAGQVYDNALTDLQNAESEMMAARAQVANDQTNLQYASVRAPFDGTIGFSAVRLGALVNQGETLLNVISSNDPIGVDFFASEKNLSKFQSLMNDREGTLADSTFTISLPDGTLHPEPGSLENMDRAVDRETGTIQIRLHFPNPDGTLKPGLSTTLRVKAINGAPVLTIPQRATMEQMGEISVFVVEDNTARERKIQPGRKFEDRVIVENGLEEGQQVIISGMQKLTNGDKITTQNRNPE
ncbi:membrane fusion protein, multidrug efflux system [Cyclobacterium lianum]|uniref:Membrane fusion protein, multidrug efflux system n=1 Tax=Cyclobacterium lianum TaxID=388280 RepID=A0A1M7QFE3_9BACT|nr:efflux RND transporter periplasmic adaptor subunit [Cyclobacterium lianum]SHN29655.1 membrane fusion protein, multidrug efflux system [Cyclobacterium lianum]